MPPPWPRVEMKLPEGIDLNALLREVSQQVQKEGCPPKLEFTLREQVIRKARIREERGRIFVEDPGDAYSLFDHADFAGVDFVEFEAHRLMYIDRFEQALQKACEAARTAGPSGPAPRAPGS